MDGGGVGEEALWRSTCRRRGVEASVEGKSVPDMHMIQNN